MRPGSVSFLIKRIETASRREPFRREPSNDQKFDSDGNGTDTLSIFQPSAVRH